MSGVGRNVPPLSHPPGPDQGFYPERTKIGSTQLGQAAKMNPDARIAKMRFRHEQDLNLRGRTHKIARREQFKSYALTTRPSEGIVSG